MEGLEIILNVFLSELGIKTTSLLVKLVDGEKLGGTIRRMENVKNVMGRK